MSQDRQAALVTGGARRVGRAIVQVLADAGFDVLFTTRGHAPDAPASPGGRIIPVNLDVTDLPQSGDQLLETIQHTVRRLDVLVHNASIYEPGDLAHASLRQIRRMNRIHIETPIMLTKALTPLLKASRGHVILMLDAAVDRPWPAYLAYMASKAAMANLTLSMARALAPEITVNGIAPGVVDWPDDMPADARERYLSRVPLARAGEPADAARIVKFLVTEGRYITGQIIRVDGGRSVV